MARDKKANHFLLVVEPLNVAPGFENGGLWFGNHDAVAARRAKKR